MKRFSKPELIEILAKNDFFVMNTHIFKTETFKYTFLYNDRIEKGIIIKEYKEEEDLKKINEEIVFIRNILKKLKFNIWNVYYFILVNNENKQKQNRKLYSIERDSRNMRKYILQSIEDLKRVPFLNIKSSLRDDTNISIDFYNFIDDSKDLEISNIINEIVSSEGEYKELTKQNIKRILKENLLQGEFL